MWMFGGGGCAVMGMSLYREAKIPISNIDIVAKWNPDLTKIDGWCLTHVSHPINLHWSGRRPMTTHSFIPPLMEHAQYLST